MAQNRSTPAQALATTAKEQQERVWDSNVSQNVRYFCERFAPEDPRDRVDFERAFIDIVREIYREAQGPLINQLGQIAAATPLSPFLNFDKKG